MIRRLHLPLLHPEDVIKHLAKGEAHWRAGYSAQELAISWANAAPGFPPLVRSLLDTAPEYEPARLIDGFFEREVDLGTPGRNSQTDLMIILGLEKEIAVAAIEGKVEESFGPLVEDWENTPGKSRRLAGLCSTLSIDRLNVPGLRYQLLHRAASAIYEAHRYHSHHALMLVHSFSRSNTWYNDFAAFAEQLEVPVSAKDGLSAPKKCEGVSLRLGWVSDAPQAIPR